MRAVQLRGGLGFAAEPLLKRGVVRVVSGRGLGGYDAVGHRVVRPPLPRPSVFGFRRQGYLPALC